MIGCRVMERASKDGSHGAPPDGARFRLHPRVELREIGADALEVVDHRTEFRLALEDIAPPELDSDVAALFESLGLCDGELTDAEVRARQHRFLDAEAWNERLERMRDLLAFAVEKVPFYRARRPQYDPARITDSGSLSGLPILRKADVRAAFLTLCADEVDLRAGLASGRFELAATSGTTDERMQAIADASLVRIPSDYDVLWNVARPEGTPRTAVLTSRTCLAAQCTLLPGAMADRLVHDYTLYLRPLRDPFRIDADEVHAMAEELWSFAPALLFVNPVYAHALGRRARELDVKLPPVDVVISAYQYLSHVQRRALGQLFGAPVRSSYSATELGGCQLGLECGRGRLHVREDHCLVEVLSRDGRTPSGKGELGAVVVTTLAGRTVPLVRYAVGDLAVLTDEACSCSLSDYPVLELHGRERDALLMGERWMTTRMVDEAIGAEEGVDFYCCRQRADGSLVIDVVESETPSCDAARLQARLETACAGVSVRVNLVDRLEPAPSLKYPLAAPWPSTATWFR